MRICHRRRCSREYTTLGDSCERMLLRTYATLLCGHTLANTPHDTGILPNPSRRLTTYQ